jgi:hypothetical protein
MNYEDFGEVFQDNFCGERFGDEQQLEVIGWSGKQSSHKLYLVQCSICKQDPELFGDGLFKSIKGNLKKGQIPCGCAERVVWSEDQMKILCERKAKDLNYTFFGWQGEFNGYNTKLILSCEKHGEWRTGSAHSLVANSSGCPACRQDALRASKIKPDSEMIASFFASGAFHPDTKFWRSERKTKQNRAIYWNVYCPVCESQGETTSDCLQMGTACCDCSHYKQRQAYINLVSDGDTPLCVKFGISSAAKKRLARQKVMSSVDVKSLYVFYFKSSMDCKAAERECKLTLDRGVVGKDILPDGWSETTYLHNMDTIIQIYKKYGGVENDLCNKVGG